MAEKLKNYFDDTLVEWWKARLQTIDGFDPRRFSEAARGFEGLEMMDRVRKIAGAFADTLRPDDDFSSLLAALPQEEVSENSVMDGYRLWPVSEYLRLTLENDLTRFDDALPLILALTKRFTSEFAVRPLVAADPKIAIELSHQWAQSDNVHVRRLSSEGLRSRLPWGARLAQIESMPHEVIGVLTKLKDDSSEYVRRSVANNLGDIAKVHPEIVIETCERWLAGRTQDTKLQKLTEHALRHILKKGDKRHRRAAFDALGFAQAKKAGLSATAKVSRTELAIGETLEIKLSVARKSSAKLTPVRVRLDFEVTYPAKSGGTRSAVFRGLETHLAPGESTERLVKRAMKPASTRPLYSGAHEINLLLNGERIETALVFELKDP